MTSYNAFPRFCRFTNISSANDFYFSRMNGMDNIVMPIIFVEVVGLEEGSCGRSCPIHTVCGTSVHEGKHLRIRTTFNANHKGKLVRALGVYAICDITGDDTCLVGFLRRHKLRHAAEYEGQHIVVDEMLVESEDPSRVLRNTQYKGCCVAQIYFDKWPKL